MRREDELALWGWAGATRMGRFNIWHPGTVQPPSYNPPTIVTSNGAPFRPFASNSLPLRRTHWTWNKRDRHIFKRIRLEHKQINESSNTNDWSWLPRARWPEASRMRPGQCDAAQVHHNWWSFDLKFDIYRLKILFILFQTNSLISLYSQVLAICTMFFLVRTLVCF